MIFQFVKIVLIHPREPSSAEWREKKKKNQSFPFSQPIRVIFAIEDFLWQVDEILNIKVGKENIIP